MMGRNGKEEQESPGPVRKKVEEMEVGMGKG